MTNFPIALIEEPTEDHHARSLGYGKALVEKAEEWAKQKGCAGLTLFTLKDWPACAWYQNLGFEIEYERDDHINHSIGCYLIKKI